MDKKVVTGEGIQKNLEKLIEIAANGINSNADYFRKRHVEILLLNKLFSNLNSSSVLASYGAIGDSKIMIRTAFETLCLIKLFTYIPERIETYKEESEVLSFRNHYGYMARGFSTPHSFAKHFSELSEKCKNKIFGNKRIKTCDKSIVKRYLDVYKLEFQNPQKNIDDLLLWAEKDSSFPEQEKEALLELREYSIHLYNVNSQIAHSSYLALNIYLVGYNDDDKDLGEGIFDCGREIIMILKSLAVTLSQKHSVDIHSGLSEAILSWYNYMDRYTMLDVKKEALNSGVIIPVELQVDYSSIFHPTQISSE